MSPGLGTRAAPGIRRASGDTARLTLNVRLVAMTLRLSEERERTLERIAETLHLSKNSAAAEAIERAAPRPNHPEFVAESMSRQLSRYADLMLRLESA